MIYLLQLPLTAQVIQTLRMFVETQLEAARTITERKTNSSRYFAHALEEVENAEKYGAGEER